MAFSSVNGQTAVGRGGRVYRLTSKGERELGTSSARNAITRMPTRIRASHGQLRSGHSLSSRTPAAGGLGLLRAVQLRGRATIPRQEAAVLARRAGIPANDPYDRILRGLLEGRAFLGAHAILGRYLAINP